MKRIALTVFLLEFFCCSSSSFAWCNTIWAQSDSTTKIENWCKLLRNSFEMGNYHHAAIYYDSIDRYFPDTVKNTEPEPVMDYGSMPLEPLNFFTIPEPINSTFCYMGSVSYQKLADQSIGLQKQAYQLRAQQIYEKGSRLFGELQMMQGLDSKGIYQIVDKQPKPVDGYIRLYEHIENGIKHPKESLEGRIFTELLVEKDSTIKYIRIAKGINNYYDEQVVQLLKSTKWIPAQLKGKPVRARMILPVSIRIDK